MHLSQHEHYENQLKDNYFQHSFNMEFIHYQGNIYRHLNPSMHLVIQKQRFFCLLQYQVSEVSHITLHILLFENTIWQNVLSLLNNY